VVAATNTEVCWYQFDGDAVIPPPKSNYPLMGVKDPPAFDPKAKVAAAVPFDPQTAPSLIAPAEERKAVTLPPFAQPLLPVVPVREAPLLLNDGKTLFAHDADTGKELWRTKLDPPAVFSRVAFTTDDKLLALGDFAVMAVERKTGEVAWRFNVPDAEPTPKLSGFVFTGNRLVSKLGDRGLIALDLTTGKTVWTRSAANTPDVEAYALDSVPPFGPHMAAIGDRVYVQRGGDCWAIDAATGEQRASFPTTVQEWSSPPVGVGEKVILPAADGTLAAVTGGVSKRFFDPGREASRTGTPPAVREFGGAVFALVSRNYGDEVYRLNSPRLLPAGVELPAADADAERLYLPGAGKVFALGRESLKEAWRATLPDMPDGTRWQVLAGRTTLIVYPTEAVRAEPWSAGDGVRTVATHPTPLRALGTTGELFDAATRFTLPVLILDSATGKIQQRIDVPVGGPTVAVLPRADGLLVAGVGRAVWLGKK
jgi:outer membrane protein assembly factor BamB